MGTYANGIGGSFTGKVGSVVGVIWKGKNVMRSVPRKRTAPLTKNEKRHRAKFALVNKFLSPVMDLLNYSYHAEVTHQTGFNKAFSYHIKNAVVLVNDKPAIDYSMALLSKGDLPKPESLVADAGSPGKIIFSWKDNSGKGQALSTDQAFVALYNEKRDEWISKTKLTERSAEKYEFTNSSLWTGVDLQIFFGFVSANGQESCDSVYAGEVVVKAQTI
jgi:hypothetical protein